MDRHSFYPLFLLTILMVAVGQMTQTLYVPSIPMMAGDFNVASGQLQAVMACYLIPYGLSQFVYGPLSDRIGRRPVLIVGMMVFLVGTLIIQVIPHFAALLVGSFIQGLGTGAGGAMSRTVMRDRYNGAELNRANSLVSMGVIFSPLLAPVLGGWLTELFNWRAGYWFLFGFGAVATLAIMAWFGETLPAAARQPLRVGAAYRHVLGNPKFQGNLLCLMATFAGLAVFEAAAGVLLGDVLKLSARTVSVLVRAAAARLSVRCLALCQAELPFDSGQTDAPWHRLSGARLPHHSGAGAVWGGECRLAGRWCGCLLHR